VGGGECDRAGGGFAREIKASRCARIGVQEAIAGLVVGYWTRGMCNCEVECDMSRVRGGFAIESKGDAGCARYLSCNGSECGDPVVVY